MKDDLAFKQSKRLGHTRQHWDIFASLAQRGVEAGGGADAIFGKKPKVADYTPTDLGEEAGKAVGANIKNYPEITKLLDSIVPGFSGMLKTGTKAAGEMIRGEIPADVQNFMRRSSAFQSLMGGFAGSAMGKALGARDLGRTSLDIMEKGQNAAQRWAGLASGLSAPYMVSAPAAAEASFRNKILQQQNLQDKYNVAAAPDPGKKGTFDLQFALGMTAASMGAGMLGGGKASYKQPGSDSSDWRNNALSRGQREGDFGGGGDSGGGGWWNAGSGGEPYVAPQSTIGNNMSYQPWYATPAPATPPGYGQGQGVYPWGGG